MDLARYRHGGLALAAGNGVLMAFPSIIVIGASTGGVPARSSFAAGLPTPLPVPILIVLHVEAPRELPFCSIPRVSRRQSMAKTVKRSGLIRSMWPHQTRTIDVASATILRNRCSTSAMR